MYIDSYADKYQELQGYQITIIDKDNKCINAYMSFEQSTRSTYDIAMRAATIDALITMKDINKLKVGQLFYKNIIPNEIYFIQSINKSEQQPKSKNINAIKQNSFTTILRKEYDEDSQNEIYKEYYSEIISFVSLQNKDEKNFAAGTEDTTIYNIQIPKKDIITDKFYDIKTSDRIKIKDFNSNYIQELKIESIDAFGIPGVIRIYATTDTRTGE